MGQIAWGDREAYFEALVRLGEQARRDLRAEKRGVDAVFVSDAWERYVASKRRPNSGDATLRAYHGQFVRLARWAPQTTK